MAVLVILGLLTLALTLITGAPVLLSRGAWRLSYPRLALAFWYGALLAGLTAIISSILITLITVTSMQNTATPTLFWVEPTALVIFGWVALAGVGAGIALLAIRAEPLAEKDRHTQAEFTLLAAMSECENHYGIDVVIVDSDAPVALSIPGPEERIIISSRLVNELTAPELRSVIEHERAHLTGRHGRLMQIAQLNSSCLPILPAARELERTTQLLIELIADDNAARRSGAVHTANALDKIGALTGDESMQLRARRVAERPPHGSLTTSRRLRSRLATH